MKACDFDKVLKYFAIPNLIEELNINYFGSCKQHNFSIDRIKPLSFLNRLREFHFLSIDFELKDLIQVVSNTNINSISF